MHAGPGGRHVNFADTVQQQPDSPTDLHNSSHYASSSSNSSPARSDLHAMIIEPMPRTVPLSSVPCQALGVETAEQKAQKQGKASHGSVDASTAVSNKTGRLSQLMDAERAKAEELKLQFNRPKQVTGRATKYHKALAWAGRIGWCGKAVVYAMIGGLACQSAVGNNRPDPNLPQTEQVAASPQGAFVLLGTTAQGVDIVMLLIMLVALAAYITWRFWEGLAGQGYDETFSSKKNFFKFRVSPIVSGCVYVSYMVFLITVIDREVRKVPTTRGPQKEGWPSTWRHNAGGRVGLALLGIAFTIATCIQLQGVLTRQWHRDYRSDLPRPLMLGVFTVGHFGFAGRAGAFLAMAVMFFKDAGGVDTPHESSMVANALTQLQSNKGLRAILMIVGILLVTYGLFATLSAFTRMFPTPPPSRRKRLPAAEYKEHQKRKEERRMQRKHRWGLPLHHAHAHNHGHDSWPDLTPDGAAHAEQPSSNTQPAVGADAAADATGHDHTAIDISQPGAACKLRYPPPAASAGAAGFSRHDTAGSGLATAASAASTSSIPIAVDASPGWGKDQGLTNSSLDLDQVSKKSGSNTDLAQLSNRSGSKAGPGFTAPPSPASRSWRGSGRSMFVAPSQRGRAAGSDAGADPVAGAVPAAGSGFPELGPLALAGEPAVAGSSYSRDAQQRADERVSDRGFVAVDL